jgi:hypothetical protein
LTWRDPEEKEAIRAQRDAEEGFQLPEDFDLRRVAELGNGFEESEVAQEIGIVRNLYDELAILDCALVRGEGDAVGPIAVQLDGEFRNGEGKKK